MSLSFFSDPVPEFVFSAVLFCVFAVRIMCLWLMWDALLSFCFSDSCKLEPDLMTDLMSGRAASFLGGPFWDFLGGIMMGERLVGRAKRPATNWYLLFLREAHLLENKWRFQKLKQFLIGRITNPYDHIPYFWPLYQTTYTVFWRRIFGWPVCFHSTIQTLS